MAGDYYRPNQQQQAPRGPPGVPFTAGGGNSYSNAADNRSSLSAPSAPSGFTFTSSRQGPQFPPAQPGNHQARRTRKEANGDRRGNANRKQAGHVPTGPAHQGRQHQQMQQSRPAHPSSRQSDNNQHSRGRGWGRGRGGRPATHDRPLLRARDDARNPEQRLGVDDNVNKFLSLEDLSASEDDMEMSESGASNGTSTQGGSHKMPRVETNARADGDSVPKWSNPDPYTVLPPPSDTTGKKTNFVQLIRKAKNQLVEESRQRNAVAANDDFISFDDHEEEEELIRPAPTGPYRTDPPPPPFPPPPPPFPPPPPPPPPPKDLPSWLMIPVPPPPPGPPPPGPPPPLSGSLNELASTGAVPRGPKRSAATADLPVRPDQPSHKRKRGQFEGGIIETWLPTPKDSPTPWNKNSSYRHSISSQAGSDYDKMCMLLHNEILDFYTFVRPSDAEKSVRMSLIKQIEDRLGPKHVTLPDNCRVYSFGSFPVELYLPAADLDIVLVSSHHLAGGERLLDYNAKSRISKVLWKAGRKLEVARIATQLEVISRAKVPLVKFVDKTTGIKVDLSFENLTGVWAQDIIQKWRDQFVQLPHIVALVKQFLVMRGLNDVHLGGIGGFSTICLVYAYLSIMQQRGTDLQNYGLLFVGFLEFWGKFDLSTQRLEMNPPPFPPRIVLKQAMGIDGRMEKPDGLSIQDPYDPKNNISGGSSQARKIFNVFAEAHKVLQKRMETLDLSGASILNSVIGGNYKPYELHRMRIAASKAKWKLQ